MPNKVGDKMLPCGTPCSCLNMSDNVLPIRRPQEEEETDKSKHAQTEQTYEKH